MLRGVRRHARFMVALALGLTVWIIGKFTIGDTVTRALMAVNAGYIAYLAQMIWLAATTTPEDLRRHSEQEDEGSTLIFLLAFAAIGIGITAIFMVLNRKPAPWLRRCSPCLPPRWAGRCCTG